MSMLSRRRRPSQKRWSVVEAAVNPLAEASSLNNSNGKGYVIKIESTASAVLITEEQLGDMLDILRALK